MSQENLHLVRSIFATWERGDYSSAEWAHSEIEYVIADGPARGRWTGLAGLAEGFRDWLSAWEEYRVEADEYRELDDERVLALVRVSGRGKTSGLELGQMRAKGASLFHIRGGKVMRLVLYFDPRARARRPRPHSKGWPAGLIGAIVALRDKRPRSKVSQSGSTFLARIARRCFSYSRSDRA